MTFSAEKREQFIKAIIEKVMAYPPAERDVLLRAYLEHHLESYPDEELEQELAETTSQALHWKAKL